MPLALISATADFEPEHGPDGMIEWTFLAPKTAEVGAGAYELRFVRTLSPAEYQNLTDTAAEVQRSIDEREAEHLQGDE
jgi:hypothetical protein